MTEISAKDVKALRDATGAGMMDAKRALVEVDGDFGAATQLLREKGLAKAATRSDRDNVEGAVSLATGDGRAALVHLKCETDFSAKSEGFLSLANEMVEAVLTGGEAAVEALAPALDDLRLAVKENVELGEVRLVEASADTTLDTYLHLQDGRGVNGVIVEGEGIDQETLHQVALHIAFAKPSALNREEIDPDRVESERAALLEITKAEGKPEQAWEKIVEGRLTGWFREMVLLEQGLHGDKATVTDSLNGGRIIGFNQAYLGA
ncbi:MAG: translation elongation factor Ts [Acidimicrobiales bacterium]|jgi:elongation factor Ts|nr:translation elongation factor Ts [Acidimicrobiaceae bacterium]MDP7258789.1 translation elongation factor Ts [Acidimicrobiales bacterium]HJO79221.1 translation elongation factor Ts [Acidimicrobiales bacterium]|tara:strand:+ start:3864 stop:4655 length:792 start_codon:yes stop_codon:yes gene_type:complete